MLMVVLSSAWSLKGGGTQVFALQDVGPETCVPGRCMNQRGEALPVRSFFLGGLTRFKFLDGLG